ncbi:MAG: exo-alpha-sialidase, partial [Chitinophagaceae bacterium]
MTIKNILLYTMILLQAAACSQRERPDITASPGRLMDSLPGSSPYLTKDNNGNMLISWVRSITDSTAIFCYSRSTDGGNSFGPVISIPSSTNIKPHAENLPKIIFKKSGEIIALWGVGNPNPNNKYSGLVYYSQSFDEGKTWQAAKPLVNDTAGYDQRYYDVSLLPSGEAAIIWLDNRSQGGRDGSALYYAAT